MAKNKKKPSKKKEAYGQIYDDFSFKVLMQAAEDLKQRFGLSTEDILEFLEFKESSLEVPIALFRNKKTGALEALCKYLKENKSLPFNDIAKALNRDNRTIWAAYHNAAKKSPSPIIITGKEAEETIPVETLSDRHYTVLESVVKYLKDVKGLKYSEIARLLAKDQRNIWLIYNRKKLNKTKTK